MFFRLLVVTVLLLLLLGCNKSGSTTPAAVVPAILPAGWSVPELTLPSDAVQHPLSYYRDVPRPDGMCGIEEVYPASGGNFLTTPQTSKLTGIGHWEVGFTSDLIWSEIAGPAESSLISAGYDKLSESHRSAPAKLFNLALYLSADKKTIVTIRQAELMLDDNSSSTVAIAYIIYELPLPVPQEKLETIKRTGRFNDR